MQQGEVERGAASKRMTDEMGAIDLEMIEQPEQIVSLRDLGCELGQGFFFAKPMNNEALFEYLGGEQHSHAA